MNIKNNINTYADLTAYNADTNKDYPNVSYIVASDEVKYGTDPRVVCIYNVTDTSAATKLLNKTVNISDMIIDGVQQPSVVTSYQFSTTGEHIVKYGLTNNTIISGNNYQYAVFQECTTLIKVTIPSSVTQIGHSSFYNNTNLTKFNSSTNGELFIPNGVTILQPYVFQYCTGFTSAIFPSTITQIGNYCFADTTNLTTITLLATTPPTLGSSNFAYVTAIYVPSESVETYKAASGWSSLASRIQSIS